MNRGNRTGALPGVMRLFSLLDVRPGEGVPITLLLLHSFALGTAVVCAEVGAMTIFLTTFSANMLPDVYIAAAVGLIMIGLAYTRLGHAVAPAWFLAAILVFLSAGAIGFALGMHSGAGSWLVFGLLTWFWALEALVGLEFWALAGQIFTLQQGKRLFGVIGAGEPAARVIGFFLIPLVVALVGTTNLIVIAAASLLFSLLILIPMIRRFPVLRLRVASGTERHAAPPQRTGGIHPLLDNPYIRAVLVTAMLSQALYFFVNYSFSAMSHARYPDAIALAQFLGIFLGVLNASRLIFRLVISRAVLTRYGLLIGLLAVPVVTGASMLVLAGAGIATSAVVILFWLTLLTRLTEGTLRQGIQRAAWQLLYQPLRPDQRLTASTMVESGAQPLAMGLAGVFMLLLDRVGGLTTPILADVSIPLIAVLLFFTVKAYRGYHAALGNALSRRRLGQQDLDLRDATTVSTLAERLSSPHGGEVLYVLDLLSQRASAGWFGNQLVALLFHPDPLVRRDAARRIEERHLPHAIPALRSRLIEEDDSETLSLIVRSLGVLGRDDPAVMASVQMLLRDPVPDVRLGAVVGLLRPPASSASLSAIEMLGELANSSDRADRALAARILEHLDAEWSRRLLPSLLNDPDVSVRRHALMAIRATHLPELWPSVVTHLSDPGTVMTASQALIAAGPSALPALLEAEPSADDVTLVALARVAGRIGEPALPLLRQLVTHTDGAVRTQALRSLSRCGYRPVGPEAQVTTRLARREVEEAATWLATLYDLRSLDPAGARNALLRRGLESMLNEHRVRICLLLSFLYDTPTMLRVEVAQRDPSAERRGFAQEVLSLTLPANLRTVILPLFSDLSPTQALQRIDALYPQPRMDMVDRLTWLIATPDWPVPAWIRSCALAAGAALGSQEIVAATTGALSHRHPMVRASAVRSLAVIDPLEYERQRLMVVADTDPQVVAAVRAVEAEQEGSARVLSTIERVIVLKGVDIFSRVEDATLAELAMLVEEIDLPADTTVFAQGDRGTSLYVVVDGQVRVHADGQTLNFLGEREVFGEMALLDPEPRMATVTTVSECRLLRLDQEPFYDLAEHHIDVTRGIIQVLSRRLRSRVRDLNAARSGGSKDTSAPALASSGE